MISQFFEIQIKDGLVNRYLDLAAALRPRLDEMGGCLFLDRFKSLSDENTLLSYQVWQDEGSLVAWRVEPCHHETQAIGRSSIFSDYRIRIAPIVYEVQANSDTWEPERLPPYNDPKRRAPTFVLAAESQNPTLHVSTKWKNQSFASVYREGQFAHLVELPDYQSGISFGKSLFGDSTTEYFRIFEVIRDYGMYDRAEAPQYYPPVACPFPKS